MIQEIITPNYTQSANDLLKICKAFKGVDTETNIFDIKLSNDEFERRAEGFYIDNSKHLYRNETKGELIRLKISNEEFFRGYLFDATKSGIEEMNCVINSFLESGEMINIY